MVTGSEGSAAAIWRGSVELQPVIIASSPESRKKGTIMRGLGVFELFIFIFIPWFFDLALMISSYLGEWGVFSTNLNSLVDKLRFQKQVFYKV
jgi:hypothetical protein